MHSISYTAILCILFLLDVEAVRKNHVQHVQSVSWSELLTAKCCPSFSVADAGGGGHDVDVDMIIF